MNKIYILVCILFCAIISSNCFAQESKVEDNAFGRASISPDLICAESTGKGSTKEEAEQAAYTYAILQIIKQINELSPEKTKIMWDGYKCPIIKSRAWSSLNGSISDKGTDAIALDKSVIEGYWEYINGAYTYRLKMLFKLPVAKEE